jgi:hypothetical protein
MSVLAILKHNQLNGCDLYRVVFPFQYLTRHGEKADYMPYKEIGERIARGQRVLTEYDTYLFARMVLKEEDQPLLKELKRHGKKLIFDMDDDLTMRSVLGDLASAFTPMLNNMDEVWVSTEVLAERARHWTKSRIRVLKNMVPISIFNRWTDTPRGPFTIALTGSDSHYEDWKEVAPILKQVKDKYPEVHIVVMGFHPDYLKDSRFELREGATFLGYAKALQGFDIILAPLNRNDMFNPPKSSLKALEAFASTRRVRNEIGGAIAIVQNHTVYEDLGSRAIRADTPDQWFNWIEYFITHKEQREYVQIQNYSWVQKHRVLEKNGTQWTRALEKLNGR